MADEAEENKVEETAAPAPEAPVESSEKTAPVEAEGSENNMAMLCHLLAFSGFIGIPFGHLLGPLIIWLIKKDEMPFVNTHGKEALNFQLSMTIYGLVSGILCMVVIGFVLIFALIIIEIVFIIKASIAASKGEHFEYPLTIRFIK